MRKPALSELLVFLAILLGSLLLYDAVPESNKNGVWTHNVLRNWEEYGFLKLRGKMVCNPGGHDALERPKIYTGHRAASLYPSYWVGHLCGGAGNYGAPFHLLLTAATVLSIWLLLNRTGFALLISCAVAFSPGYLRFTTLLDPMAVPVLLGLPVMCWTCQQLESSKLKWTSACALSLLLVSYALLNWTVAFPFAITAAYLLVSPKTPRKRFLLFCAIATGAVAAVALVSLRDKMGTVEAGTASRWEEFYNAYLFGPGGYMRYPMNWPRAIVRLIAANAVGLLSVLILLGWALWRALVRKRTFEWKALLPFVAALLSVAVMRNYFAHHPWMAAAPLIFGILFTTKLLLPGANAPDSTTPPFPALAMRFILPLFIVLCFVYGYCVVLLLRVNSAEMDSLLSLVRQETRRHDVLIVSTNIDPILAQNSTRLSEVLDRRLMTVERSDHPLSEISGGKLFLLTAHPKPENVAAAARTLPARFFSQKIMQQALNWYRRVIARRSREDQFEAEPIYFLFPYSENLPR